MRALGSSVYIPVIVRIKINTAAYLVILLSVMSGCRSSSRISAESLRIDGSSVQAYRASHVAIMTSLEENPPLLVSFLKGYFAVKLRAQKSIDAEDMKAIATLPQAKIDALLESRGERLEKMEMQILDGLDFEEVIEHGHEYEDETGMRLIPRTL